MNNHILIIAAHADDEVLGCGGTIARHIADGDDVTVVYMTDGISARENNTNTDKLVRNQTAIKAMQYLKVNNIKQFKFPDNKMDTVPLLDVVKEIEKIIFELQPNIIYTHFSHDLNVDHRITHNAVMTACRPQKNSSVKEIYTFEVLSSTEWNSTSSPQFTPQCIIDITNFWPQKLEAIKFYQNEMRTFPHSRSYECLEALATLRGATHGFEKAEAFFIERILK